DPKNPAIGAIDDYLDELEDPVRMHSSGSPTSCAEQHRTLSRGRTTARRPPGERKALLGFRVAKHHDSIFPFSAEVVAAVADDLDGFSVSKDTIRFTADNRRPSRSSVVWSEYD